MHVSTVTLEQLFSKMPFPADSSNKVRLSKLNVYQYTQAENTIIVLLKNCLCAQEVDTWLHEWVQACTS